MSIGSAPIFKARSFTKSTAIEGDSSFGVITQGRAKNKSARALPGPPFSLPAIGWEPM